MEPQFWPPKPSRALFSQYSYIGASAKKDGHTGDSHTKVMTETKATQRFDRNVQSLALLNSFIEGFLASLHAPAELYQLITLVAEELFTNMVKYNPSGPRSVGASLYADGSKIVFQMEDAEDNPFDPTANAEVDTGLPLESRRPGGLGIHLIRNMMDEFTYSYTDGISRITAVKYLENKHV